MPLKRPAWLARLHSDLSVRILAWAFIPAMLTFLVVGLFALSTYQRVTESLVKERNQELTRLTAWQIATDLTSHAETLDSIATLRDAIQFDPSRQQLLLRWLQPRLRSFDAGVVILDAQGRVTATDPQRQDVVGQDWSSRSYFRWVASGKGQILLSSIEYDAPNGGPVVAVAVPIQDAKGTFKGVIAGMFSLIPSQPNALYESLIKRHVRTTTRAYLVDAQGRTLDCCTLGWLGQKEPTAFEVIALSRGESGAVRTRDAQGEEIIASYAPIPQSLWGLVEEERWQIITQLSTQYGRLLLLILALGVMLPLLFAILGMRRIMRPVTALTAAARRMAAGELEQEIPLPRERQLAQLAEAFNAMSAELRALYDGLERKVADRTRELLTLNTLANALSRSLDLEEILEVALRHTLEALAFPMGAAYRLEKEEERFALVAQVGLAEETAQRLRRVPTQAFLWETPLKAPTHFTLTSLPPNDLIDLLCREGWQDVIALPLFAKGEMAGLIHLASPVPYTLQEEERSLLTAMGQQISMAVENARLYEEAEETAITAERHRLARELHDSVTQALFSANLIAGVLPSLWEENPTEARERQAELHQLIQGALAEMRTLLLELRPQALVEARLTDLLMQLALAVAARGHVAVDVQADQEPSLTPDVRIAFYRVAQEALNNALKHANAHHIGVILQVDPPENDRGNERVCLRICDDGQGFDPAHVPSDRLGLVIMRERAQAVGATLEIRSAPGSGTCITLSWGGDPPGGPRARRRRQSPQGT